MRRKVKNVLKKYQSKFGGEKDRAYYFQKNEEQLQREKVILDYEYIRSLAR